MTTYPINTSVPLSACFSNSSQYPVKYADCPSVKKQNKKTKHPRTYFPNTNFSAKLLLSDGNLCSLMRLYRKCATKPLSLFHFFSYMICEQTKNIFIQIYNFAFFLSGISMSL